MSNATECTFCDLINGSAGVSVCHEDNDAIAFMDTRPVNTGHVIVIPRTHYHTLVDLPPDVGLHLFQVTMRLAKAIRKVTGSDDVNIVVNSGAAAGQDEPHYHVHIIPRRPNDGFGIALPFADSRVPDREALDATAVQLIAAMRDPIKRKYRRRRGDNKSGVTAPRQLSDEQLTAKTVQISARDVAAMAAATGAIPVPRNSAPPAVADVVARSADESVSSGDPSRRGSWHVEEGAHGELLYDVRDKI